MDSLDVRSLWPLLTDTHLNQGSFQATSALPDIMGCLERMFLDSPLVDRCRAHLLHWSGWSLWEWLKGLLWERQTWLLLGGDQWGTLVIKWSLHPQTKYLELTILSELSWGHHRRLRITKLHMCPALLQLKKKTIKKHRPRQELVFPEWLMSTSSFLTLSQAERSPQWQPKQCESGDGATAHH